MTKFFENYKSETNKLTDNYSLVERENAAVSSVIFAILIAIPFILIDINCFYVFASRPYLMTVITGLLIVYFIWIGFIIHKAELKSLRVIQGLSYNRIIYTRFLFIALILIVITILFALILVPILFLA